MNRRKEDRLWQEIPVHWAIDGCSGEGAILDVSRTGAKLRVPADFDASSGMKFTLHAPTVPLLPHIGILLWFRRDGGQAAPDYVCGLVFSEFGTDLDAWGDWLRTHLESGALTDD